MIYTSFEKGMFKNDSVSENQNRLMGFYSGPHDV